MDKPLASRCVQIEHLVASHALVRKIHVVWGCAALHEVQTTIKLVGNGTDTHARVHARSHNNVQTDKNSIYIYIYISPSRNRTHTMFQASAESREYLRKHLALVRLPPYQHTRSSKTSLAISSRISREQLEALESEVVRQSLDSLYLLDWYGGLQEADPKTLAQNTSYRRWGVSAAQREAYAFHWRPAAKVESEALQSK